MADHADETRRDPRYNLRADRAFAGFDDARADTRWYGRLLSLSAAGIALMFDARFHFGPGTVLEGVSLQVGDCRLQGRIAVKNVRPVDDVGSIIGGLFYPANEEHSRLLMAVIAGMEAVDLESEAGLFPAGAQAAPERVVAGETAE